MTRRRGISIGRAVKSAYYTDVWQWLTSARSRATYGCEEVLKILAIRALTAL